MRITKKFAAKLFYLCSHSKGIIDSDVKFARFNSVADAVVHSRPFASIFLFRLRKESRILGKAASLFIKPMSSLELNVTSGTIGKGFRIWHGYGTVIFCESIGESCAIYQGVTLGRGRRNQEGRDIPVICDNVNIFANAVVIGGINIGNNVDIGAGAVVTHDVPDNCVVAGVPARVIRYKQ